MNYTLKDWFFNLKETNELTELNLTASSSKHKQASTNRLSLVLFSSTISGVIVINSFLLGPLIKFLITNDGLTGLVFLQTCIITTTASLLYYPSFRLNSVGRLNLSVLKWVFGLIMAAVFFHMMRNHTKVFSSLVLASLTGVKLFRELPFVFPKTFTFNELLIVCSMFSSWVFTFCFNVIQPPEQMIEELFVVEHSLVWLVLVVFFVRKLKFVQNSLVFFALNCVWLLTFYFIPTVYLSFQQNPFVWLANYLFTNGQKRVYLFSYWMLLFVLMTALVLAHKLISNSTTNELHKNSVLTRVRKVFHLLIMIVFVLGFMHDRNLLFLCSYGMLILLALTELVRYYKIGLLGRVIQDSMSIFVDEKDHNSSLILSHVYLLVGLSYALWMSTLQEFNVAELSGLITVGVGDSFASLVGSKYGRHRYPGSKRTIEGTIALVVSQLVVYFLIHFVGLVNIFKEFNFFLLLFNLVLTAYVEAFSSDNDNLVLPMVAYPILYLMA